MNKYVRSKVSQIQDQKLNAVKSVLTMIILLKCIGCATIETPAIEPPEEVTAEKQKEAEANRMREHYHNLRERFVEWRGKHGE